MSLSSGLKCKGFVQGQRKLSVITKRMSAKRGNYIIIVMQIKLMLLLLLLLGLPVAIEYTTMQLIMFYCIRNRLWNRPINTCLSFHYLLEHYLQQWFFFHLNLRDIICGLLSSVVKELTTLV